MYGFRSFVSEKRRRYERSEMSQQAWTGWSPLSMRWGPPPWPCDDCKRTLPAEAFTDRPDCPLHGESVCNDCQTKSQGIDS